jgi:hypothetical protein
MVCRHGHLGRADKIHLVFGKAICLLLSHWKIGRAHHGLVFYQMRHDHWRKSLAYHLVQGKLQDGLFQQGTSIFQEIRACPGQFDPAWDVNDIEAFAQFNMIAQGKVELRYLTPRFDHDVVRVGQSLRHVVRRDIRHTQHECFKGRFHLTQRTF